MALKFNIPLNVLPILVLLSSPATAQTVPRELDCFYQSPQQWLADFRAAVARGEVVDPLAFQTSENPAEVQAATGEPVVAVFLPTTPNPTSGFMLFVPTRSVIELDMSVEEALKMIISLGVVVPQWHPVHPTDELAPPEPSP